MNPPVFPLLSTDAAVVAIIGATPNCKAYPKASVPQDIQAPYVAWFIVSDLPEKYLSEKTDMYQMRVQIDCWGATQPAADALFAAVDQALEQSSYRVGADRDGQDPDTLTYVRGADFSFWVQRT